MKQFIAGRKEVMKSIHSLDKNRKTIWFHAASLGEFEQGRPVIEAIKNNYPQVQILLTFFSPSGYEIRKNYEKADCICYLPLDTIKNATTFIEQSKPALSIFIKYEFWPNYLKVLKKEKIPTILISGIFRKEQLFFKSYGGFMRESLNTFAHFFVQNQKSKTLLESIKIKSSHISVSGDTRFDRVAQIKNQNNQLDFMDQFCANAKTLVVGSSWPEDEEGLVAYINSCLKDDQKVVFAPHNIKQSGIQNLYSSLRKPTAILSKVKEQKQLANTQVLIVDSIGLLTKVYSYAQIAYVGGGYNKSGVHNVLEPAVFGCPIIIGPNYKKFEEVKDLVSLRGITVCKDTESLNSTLTHLFASDEEITKQGRITDKYVQSSLGATEKIMDFINKNMR